MTIPIIPGPFSFLAQAGQGVGDAINARSNRVDKDREAAGKQLQEIFAAVQKGTLSTNVFKSPYIADLAQRTGIGDFLSGNIRENPQEAIDTARSGMIPDAVDSLSPEGQRDFARTGNMPTGVQDRLSVIAEEQLAPGNLTQAQKRAISKVPSATTAAAGEIATEDPGMTNIADRHVQSLYATKKRLPTIKEAMDTALSDPNTSGVGTRLTKEHFGQAIEKQRRQLADEFTKQLIAQARKDSGDDPTKFLTRLTSQMDGLRKQRADLAKSVGADQLVSLHLRAKKEGRKVGDIQAEIQGQIDLIDAQIGSLQQQFTNAAGMQQPGSTTTPKYLTPAQISGIVSMIKKQPNLASAIDADVASGLLSPEDARKIRDQIRGAQ